jgi:hypothetical protein
MKKNILLEECIKSFKTKEFKEELKILFKPLIDYLFNELYIYILFVILLIIASFFLHLGVLILLLRYNKIKN